MTRSFLPITVLSGFLGSGKTTLLRRWRQDDALRDAAVIVHDLSEFELTGQWRAELANSPDHKLLPEERAILRERAMKQDPVFGDRHIELTLIGLPAAREAFAAALRNALCTDDEVAAWQRGEPFADPWPQSFKRVTSRVCLMANHHAREAGEQSFREI